jgi:hypothetical protein
MPRTEKVIHRTEGTAVETAAKPYVAAVAIEGVADLLFHRWTPEAITEKANAAKGSKQKKTDDIESYVYRDDHGRISLPGEYVRQSLIHAAKYRQDPRSPKKSAMDICKAGVICLTQLASLGKDDWDYLDMRRVVIQRNGINRIRPAMRSGWKAAIDFMVVLPEYIDAQFLNGILVDAGRLVGVGDFRPTYGRFQITRFDIRNT